MKYVQQIRDGFGMVTLLVMALLCCQTALAQVKVSGTVTDRQGEALVGVAVVSEIDGVRTGVSTDDYGRFSLSVPEGTMLEFNYLGFKTLKLPAVTPPHAGGTRGGSQRS